MFDLAAASEHLLATRAWSQAGLDSFDHVTTESRRTLRETTLEGLDVTEVKYRIDAPGRKTAEAFGVSCSKPPTDLAAFCDHLDHIGPSDALGATDRH